MHEQQLPRRRAGLFALVTLSVAIVGCDRGATDSPHADTPPPGERLVNETLDLALARVPASLAVRENGAAIRLAPAAAGTSGELRIEVGAPSDFGIDVVQIANDQQAAFGQSPGGEFFGAQKLVTPLGEATYARGRLDADDGSRVEETRAYAIHPTANRLITVTYRYPAAEDSRERVGQLLEVLGEIEARVAPAESAAAAGS
jgi:hypothetical protein